jgi:hypothetical protein
MSYGFGCKKSVRNLETEVPQHISNARMSTGNKQVQFPSSEDPGAPLYMRIANTMNQFFVTDGWLVIPFYRDPSCVRPDFNLLNLFDVPAAFGCSLTVSGFYTIEKDATPGTFPITVQSTGSAVPFWFVKREDFETAKDDGVITIGELQNMNPLIGSATKFHETLRPRFDNHFVQINASGTLTDGRRFEFHVTHVEDQTKHISLSIK